MNIESIYSAEHFSSLADEARDALSSKIYTRQGELDLSPKIDIGDLKDKLEQARSHFLAGDSRRAFESILSGAVNLHHPRFMSQQLAAPAPVSVVADMVVSAMNQGHAVFDMSPLNSLIEEDTLGWVREKLRLDDDAFGLVTGGGSLSNLSALLAARNYLTDWERWKTGNSTVSIEVITSKLSHYSISRAAGILGIGEENVRTVDADSSGRIDVRHFESVLQGVHDRGSLPVVCLTIGNTSTGSVDPIVPCLWLTRNMFEKSWVHVDAAHGGYLSMMNKYGIFFDSLNKCDSVTWNAHKMLFQSIPLSFLFFTSQNAANYTGSHESPYLSQRMKGEMIDKAAWTLECSRRSSALKLWSTICLYGDKYFIDAYECIDDVTCYTYDLLKNNENYYVIGPPESNIVAFRYKSVSLDKANYINEYVVKSINDRAEFLIGFTRIDGYYYIRLTFMNPKTTRADVDALMSTIQSLVVRSERYYQSSDIV